MTETGAGDTPLADRPSASPAGEGALDSTYALVERAKTGDRDALDRLFARFLPSLRRSPAKRGFFSARLICMGKELYGQQRAYIQNLLVRPGSVHRFLCSATITPMGQHQSVVFRA